MVIMTLRQGTCGLCQRVAPVATVLVYDPALVRTAADFASVCYGCRTAVDAIVASMLAEDSRLRVHITYADASEWVAV